MKRITNLVVGLALVFVVLGGGRAVEASEFPIHLFAIQANAINVRPSVGDSSLSGQVSYAPRIDLGLISLRGELGITVLKGSFPESFIATNYEAFVGIPLFPTVSIEAGGGFSTWGQNVGTHPILSGYFVLSPPWGIDRIFFAYSRFLVPNAGVNELKLGIGFDLF